MVTLNQGKFKDLHDGIIFLFVQKNEIFLGGIWLSGGLLMND